MWCTKRRVEPYVYNSQPNNVNSAVLSGSEFVEPSPLHEFMFQEINCDGKKSIRITSDLRKKMTDEQLCSFVKSRFIQTPSELMAWSQYLMSSQDTMIAAAAAENQPASEPTPASEPAPTAE